jgi:hypothetical protein
MISIRKFGLLKNPGGMRKAKIVWMVALEGVARTAWQETRLPAVSGLFCPAISETTRFAADVVAEQRM